MNGEWQRHSPPVRLPRRPTDRVEDVAAWVLTILGVLTAVLAVTTGLRLYDEGMHRIGLETRERMQVQAVLLGPANPNAAGERPPGVRVVAVPTSIRYLAPDGAEYVADVPVTGAVAAGRAARRRTRPHRRRGRQGRGRCRRYRPHRIPDPGRQLGGGQRGHPPGQHGAVGA